MQLKPKKDLIKVMPAANMPVELTKKKWGKGLKVGLGLLTGFFGVSVILIVFALPSLLNCTSKAKQAEGRQTIGRMNRAQQAYFLEKSTFSQSLEQLEAGIKAETANYQYSTRATATSAFNYAIARQGTNNIKSYVGAVFLVSEKSIDPKANKDKQTTLAILCEAKSLSKNKLADPVYQNGAITCGSGTAQLP